VPVAFVRAPGDNIAQATKVARAVARDPGFLSEMVNDLRGVGVDRPVPAELFAIRCVPLDGPAGYALRRPMPYCRFLFASLLGQYVRREFSESERREHPEIRVTLAKTYDDGTGESVNRVVGTPTHFAGEVARLQFDATPLVPAHDDD
jgi:hypothetical protein